MPFETNDIIVVLLSLLALILLVNLVLLYKSSKLKQSLLQIINNRSESHQESLALKESISTQATNLQVSLMENLMSASEKQLESTGQLKLDIEKRMAEANLSFSKEMQDFKQRLMEGFEQLKTTTARAHVDLKTETQSSIEKFGQQSTFSLETQQNKTRELIDAKIRQGLIDIRKDVESSLKRQSEVMNESMSSLTQNTDNRLKEISGQVEKRLSDGFDKTTQTFNDILKRLALIDDAQKKITELSGNVVSLQEILNDKRSRGAFGEVQLNSLIANVMPKTHYEIQQKLSNERIADCVLLLPEPTGKIAIDAKFPLESYKRMTDVALADSDRSMASRQFVKDIKKHIQDIASKYILPPETSDGAVMFIPAESIFAEIHGHYPELVELAYQKRVWMVSPTTLMAILTTSAAVIKDEETRKQVHIIQNHLNALGKDFGRFQDRMDNLSRHIGQVSKDVELVHVSARKISSRFDKIEQVDLSHDEPGITDENQAVRLQDKKSMKLTEF